MNRREIPVVDVFGYRPVDQDRVFAFWCPWCEAFHTHGLIPGRRAPHRYDWPGSLFRETGYVLEYKGEIEDLHEAVPYRAPLAGRRTFASRLLKAAPSLRRAVLKALFPYGRIFKRGDGGEFRAAVLGHTITFELTNGGWTSESRVGSDRRFGLGLLALIEELFGIPPYVAVHRLVYALDDRSIRDFTVVHQ